MVASRRGWRVGVGGAFGLGHVRSIHATAWIADNFRVRLRIASGEIREDYSCRWRKSDSAGAAGFCDKLVELIGRSVTTVTRTDAFVLCLCFSGGVTFHVEADHEPSGPEAFDFIGRNHYWRHELNG